MSRYEKPKELGEMLVRMRRDLEAMKRPTVLRPPHYATADRPDPATAEGGLIYNTTTNTVQYSDGSSWSSL